MTTQSIARIRSLQDIDANTTVESFLVSQRDKLVNEMETMTGSLVEELQESCDKAKANLRTEFASATPAKTEPFNIKLEVVSGPHTGTKFDLCVDVDEACYVGRSTGKKFRTNGISLPKDSEVSTTHAKFEIQRGQVVIIDVGSTNGTTLDNVELLEHVAAPVTPASQTLLFGSSAIRIHSLAPLRTKDNVQAA
mmetsp:Transcript_20351/g.26378  ORF Transcript_20351/g.26378 Transcript_20351/m.26378 type:complete len:194 (-) Transcript_20351:1511-2092(-)